MPIRLIFLTIASFASSLASPLSAVTHHLTPADDWVGIFNDVNFLNPGDEIVLGEGTYLTGTRLSIGYQGTAANPVTIRAADGASVVMKYPLPAQNNLNIEGAQYLTIKGIEFTGGSAGIRISSRNNNTIQSKFITLDGNHIHHIANAGITANHNGRTYEGMHFLNNEIHDTGAEGEGFYLGCNNNACQFFDGVIEQNYIHNLDGPTITQGDGIEIKDGSYNNIIRDNVIHDTNFPGILVYGVEEQGARNLIERNVMWNINNHAIQAAADVTIRNNLIFSADFDGIHSQNHQGATPGNLTIANNTIHTGLNAIDIGFPNGGSYSGPIEITNNALYPGGFFAIDKFVTAGITSTGNVGTGSASGLAFDSSGNLLTDFVDFAGLDAFPAIGSKLIGAGNTGVQPSDDFNTTSRTGSNDSGAYVYDASGNPGWDVISAFKEFPFQGTPGDFNGDNFVDGTDFLLWQQGFGSAYTASDLVDWETNYGASPAVSAAGVGTVPEPSSLLLLLVGSTLARGSCRRRS